LITGLEPFRDLVFSPLALPSPPQIAADELIEWMRWARTEGLKIGLNGPERSYEARTGRQYPWLMANVVLRERGDIGRSFEREFPQLREYCSLFPVGRPRCLVILAQRGGMDVHMHADSDGYWGLRFYLANKHQEGLHFYMARAGLDVLPRGTDALPKHVDPAKHYARWPSRNTPYCVNSLRAAHAVDRNTCRLGERIACLLLPDGEPDEAALVALLRASTLRFAQYQIWHHDANRGAGAGGDVACERPVA
jgi:hypothetical protein